MLLGLPEPETRGAEIDGYRIYNGNDYIGKIAAGYEAKPYTLSGLPQGARLRVQVGAYSALCGEGPRSAVSLMKTGPAEPPLPV